jgi:hypothetical protein
MITRSDRISPPRWTGERLAPRVLVESADETEAESFARAIDRQGWDTAICPGPDKLLHGCPLLNEGSCPVADVADVVLYSLRLGEVRNRSVLWTHRPVRSARPVVVCTTGPEAAGHENVLDGLAVLEEPVKSSAFIEAMQRAMTGRRRYLNRAGAR